MKKVLGISLLFCLFLPLLTTYTWLHIEKHQLKRQLKWRMIAGLDRKELSQLRFSTTETKTLLRWEHSREFEYAGNMYDIVEKEERADSVFYTCWLDDEETALNKKLETILHHAFHQSPKQRDGKSRMNKFFDSLYFCAGVSSALPTSNEVSLLIKQPEHFNYHSPNHSPPSPPPKGTIF